MVPYLVDISQVWELAKVRPGLLNGLPIPGAAGCGYARERDTRPRCESGGPASIGKLRCGQRIQTVCCTERRLIDVGETQKPVAVVANVLNLEREVGAE